MGHYRQGSSYQHSTHPSLLLNSSSMASRGRSLTPPSLKQSSHLSSMHHLRSEEFYPPYPAHLYLDPSAYYRPYDDPYMASRLPAFFPSMMPSSSSRAYGDLYPSASIDRHRRSRSRSRRRYASFITGLRRWSLIIPSCFFFLVSIETALHQQYQRIHGISMIDCICESF